MTALLSMRVLELVMLVFLKEHKQEWRSSSSLLGLCFLPATLMLYLESSVEEVWFLAKDRLFLTALWRNP